MEEDIFINRTALNSSVEENNIEPGSDGSVRTQVFWAYVGFYISIAIIAVIGNTCVLVATYGSRNLGPLRHLDTSIKSLAVTDMLFGLVGVPCRLVVDYEIGE
jgi:hypothetical protein